MEANKRALGRDAGNLAAASPQGAVPVPVRKYADGTLVTANVAEIETFDAFVRTHGGVVPVNIHVLRDWRRLSPKAPTTVPNGKKPIAIAA